MYTQPNPRLVLAYLGEKIYHRGSADDDLRPVCRPTRIRGVPMMRVFAERDGLSPCSNCFPPSEADSGK